MLHGKLLQLTNETIDFALDFFRELKNEEPDQMFLKSGLLNFLEQLEGLEKTLHYRTFEGLFFDFIHILNNILHFTNMDNISDFLQKHNIN